MSYRERERVPRSFDYEREGIRISNGGAARDAEERLMDPRVKVSQPVIDSEDGVISITKFVPIVHNNTALPHYGEYELLSQYNIITNITMHASCPWPEKAHIKLVDPTGNGSISLASGWAYSYQDLCWNGHKILEGQWFIRGESTGAWDELSGYAEYLEITYEIINKGGNA